MVGQVNPWFVRERFVFKIPFHEFKVGADKLLSAQSNGGIAFLKRSGTL